VGQAVPVEDDQTLFIAWQVMNVTGLSRQFLFEDKKSIFHDFRKISLLIGKNNGNTKQKTERSSLQNVRAVFFVSHRPKCF